MGFQFGPFDISGSVITITGSINTSGSLNTVGSVNTSGSINLTGSITSTGIKSTLTFSDMSFNHVSGTRSYYAGVGTAFNALLQGFGSGNDGSSITLIPTASAGYPKSAAFTTVGYKNARLLGYRIYSNISTSDFPAYDGNWNSGTGPTVGYVSIGYAYLAPSSTSGQAISEELRSSQGGQYVPYSDVWSVSKSGSVLNNPPEILDSGTLYITGSSPYVFSLGPTPYSPTYITFLMSIGAGFPTKTYKFRFELDIEDQGY